MAMSIQQCRLVAVGCAALGVAVQGAGVLVGRDGRHLTSEASGWAGLMDDLADWAPCVGLELACFGAACLLMRVSSKRRAARPSTGPTARALQSGARVGDADAAGEPAAPAPKPRRRGGDPRKVLAEMGEGDEITAERIMRMVDEAFCAGNFHAQADASAWVERLCEQRGVVPPSTAYEKFILMYARVPDAVGAETPGRMVRAGHTISDGFCRYAMSRCAESQNVPLAEALLAELKGQSSVNLQTYKCMMKVYACVGRYDKACDVYQEIVEAGIEPDGVTYGNLMKFAAKAGRYALAQELLRKSEGTGCVKTFLWTIRIAGQEGDLPRAMGAFEQLRNEQPGMVDGMAYNIVIDACCSNKDMKGATHYFDEMEVAGLRRNHVTYNTMIKGYSALSNLAKVKEMIAEMQANGYTPDAASYSCLLGCAARQLDFDEVWRILQEMENRRLRTDSYVVSIMMQAARRTQCMKQAAEALSILDRPDVEICEDAIVFNTVLDACIAHRDCRHLDRALKEFQKQGSKLQATTRTYGLLIKACGTLGRASQSMEMWRDMLARNIQPNSVTLGCIIDALVEGRCVDEALALFQEWKGKVKCDTITYSTLIKGFSAINDPDRAMALYADMKTLGVQLNHVVYTALITACARMGQTKRADSVLADMIADGCTPNAITYSVLIRGHCVRGDLTAALDIFQQLVGLGFTADCIIFNTLLDGCVQHANWELAERLLEEMKKQKIVQSNFTVSIVVKMWSKRGKLDKAIETVYEALKQPQMILARVGKRVQSKNVDAHVGACLVGACIHNRAPEKAMEIFKDMKTWKDFNGPDANTYNAMICGLVKHGYTHEAADLAEEACMVLRASYDRQMLHSSAIRQLYRGLRNSNLLEEIGVPLRIKLIEAGVAFDERWLQQEVRHGSSSQGPL